MLISLGLDFRHAPLAVREEFHVPPARLPDLYEEIPREGMLRELVLVHTCNRVEAFAWAAPDVEPVGRPAAVQLARRWAGSDARTRHLLRHGRVRVGRDVAEHAVRVASGLESQVLGDIHILGQVRRAYLLAQEQGAAGTHLHRLFDTALRAGKEVKTDTELMAGRRSVGEQAAAYAARQLEDREGVRCVVLGCGKTGRYAARGLRDEGIDDLVLVNRTAWRSRELADELGGRAADIEDLYREVAAADVAVVATSAGRHLLEAESLAEHREDDRPLLVMDISMPRNVEEAVDDLPGVRLINLDHLDPEAAAVEAARLKAAGEAAGVAENHASAYLEWLRNRRAREALRPLQERLEAICRRELGYVLGDDPDAERAAGRIVAKFMARPMTAVRQDPEERDRIEALTATLGQVFGEPSARRGDGARAPRA